MPRNDLNGLARRMEGHARTIERNIPKLKVRVATAVHREVVLGTPVDTGRARSNWQLSVGTPILTQILPYAPGKGLGRSEGANAQGAIAQGQLALLKLPGEGEKVYIANNVPYINKLNAGGSSQAPAAFVEFAVIAGIQAAFGVKLLEK